MTQSADARIWFLRNTPIFEDQSESMYESVGSRSQLVDFERGDTLPILDAGQTVIYVLAEGQVKLRSQTEAGKEIILDVLGPGSVFGPLDQVLEEHHRTKSAEHLGALASE